MNKLVTKKRSKLDIVVEAIKITKEYPTKTGLINELNIGWEKGKEIIKILLSKGLIYEFEMRHSNNVTVYHITPNGMDVIKKYDEIISEVGYMVLDNKYMKLHRMDDEILI